MALALDVADNSGAKGEVSSASYTHSAAAGATGVGVWLLWVDTGDKTISSVTYGSVGCTQQGSTQVAGSYWKAALFSLNNLQGRSLGGNQTVEVTFSDAISHGCCLRAVTVTGGDTTDVFSATNGVVDSTYTPSNSVTSAAGEVVAEGMCIQTTGLTSVGDGQTKDTEVTLSAGVAFGCTKAGASGSVSMSYVLQNVVPTASMAASFKEASGAAGLAIPVAMHYYGQL